MQLDAIPASSSGKVDRKALPAMRRSTSGSPPHDGVERRIADIWERLLQLHDIGRDDNFFRLGGNSILAVRMQAEARETLGIDFAMSAFYRSSSIASLAAGQHEDMIELAIADAGAQLVINDPAPPLSGETRAAPVRSMLLTGATGFLGIYLLDDLVKQVDKVVCLQRCDSATTGKEALRQKAREAGLVIDFSRVEVISADLAAPDLGLDSVQWHRLAGEVDAILHCGAFVHHLHGYAEMKRANVGGTESLLRLALTQRQKPLCFISTMSVPEMQEGFKDLAADGEITTWEPREFIDANEHIVVLGFVRVTLKETGKPFETEWVHICTIKDGLLTRWIEFFDTAARLTASLRD
jgi:NAD(P)-dependent dehydrogenase (short-subunit alcohol dehydrogenase family)